MSMGKLNRLSSDQLRTERGAPRQRYCDISAGIWLEEADLWGTYTVEPLLLGISPVVAQVL